MLAGSGVLLPCRLLTSIQRPFAVWIVAPVAMPTLSAELAKLNSYRLHVQVASGLLQEIRPLLSCQTGPCLRSMARMTVASIKAKPSPTHLRAPPPKGMKAKSELTSLGYNDEPCAAGRYPAQEPAECRRL